jgi:small-conductance mechanosensitive channel
VQALPPTPLSRPDCLIWFPGDTCDQQLQQYRQAAEQRQQQEFQNAATARYDKKFADQQKVIADQQTQIRALQTRLDSQTTEALRSEARTQAFFDGLGGVIGIALAFVVVMASFRKLARPGEEDRRPTEATPLT